MATSDAYTSSSSVVEAKPRMREEVREELREEIRVLDMSRVTPEDKLRLERQAVEGAVGDVELFERGWRKTAPETLSEIQRKIDTLGTGPRIEPTSAPETPRPRAAAPDLTPAPAGLPAASGKSLSKKLTPTEQRKVAEHLGGEVRKATVLFTTTRGRVVDVEYARGGQTFTTMVIFTVDGEVATIDEVGAKLDSMAAPRTAATPVSLPEAEAAEGVDATEVIEAIEGIGPTYGRRLGQAGIGTVEALIAADPDDLAARVGAPAETVRKWQAMGRLQGVSGIGPQYSELLVRAGITSPSELAQQEPEELAAKLTAYQDSLGQRVQGNEITPGRAKGWVEAARDLTGEAPEEPAEEAEEAAPAAKKGPKLGKKKAEAPKKKLGLPLGKKKAAAPAEEEAGEAEEPEEPAEGKKKFSLKFGRKK